MKRLTLLAVALTMVLGMAASAFAAPEVKISGQMIVGAVWKANWAFNEKAATISGNDAVTGQADAMTIFERVKLGFTAVANENLKAVVLLSSNRQQLGTPGALTPGDAAAALFIEQAYLDFMVPDTSVNVKAGFMPVGLPGAVAGTPIFDDTVTGVLVSSALTDNVSLAAGWLRFEDIINVDGGQENDDQIDAWALLLPLSFEGVSATPFFVYSDLDRNAENNVVANAPNLASAYHVVGTDELENAYWVGSDLEISILDPFIIKADVNYGSVNSDNETGDRAGWYAALGLDYTGFDFGVLSFAYAYTSGLDDDGDEDERLPVISDGWKMGTFFYGGLVTGDDIGDSGENLGFHALNASLTGLSFFEGLTHDLHLVYAWGTNDRAVGDANTAGINYGLSLLEDDTMFEVDFNSFYQLYDELKLINGISYVAYDVDENDWVGFNNAPAAGNFDEDAWKFELMLQYDF